ncbi:MAG: Hsp20/alpha crystallin family protein [Nitrosopumilales archaeon]|nr:MAG: Hsp20/alpha crystallin family protein [Nitrosopumilales archaeon]
MTNIRKSSMAKKDEGQRLELRRLDDLFEGLRKEMDNMFRPWPVMGAWHVPSLQNLVGRGIRMPLGDLADKGDKYELQLEIPGINKESIDIKATRSSVEISGKQSEKTDAKRKDYVFNERSYRSFHRKVDMPVEIVPSKVEAKMENGMLHVQLPKKYPTKLEETNRIEVK